MQRFEVASGRASENFRRRSLSEEPESPVKCTHRGATTLSLAAFSSEIKDDVSDL